MTTLDDFLQMLYTDNRSQAKEWRGANIPYGDDSNRPNLIRKCMTMEGKRQKINCLRKLRDQAAMNPFYQARLDRFVDAVTGYYEPTDHPGTIPGNEFKETAVGEDFVGEEITEGLDPANVVNMAILAGELGVYIKNNTTKCKRKCSKMVRNTFAIRCRIRCDISATLMTIKGLERKFNECQTPKCKGSIRNKITKQKKRVTQLKHKYNAIEQRIKQETAEKEKAKAKKKWEKEYDKNKRRKK